MIEISIDGKTFYLSEKGGLFGICVNCGKFIKFNKPVLGSLHICN